SPAAGRHIDPAYTVRFPPAAALKPDTFGSRIILTFEGQCLESQQHFMFSYACSKQDSGQVVLGH
ncbi:MAG: hypothetical protein ACOCPP_00540, partial [Desulfovermiculus sp.]